MDTIVRNLRSPTTWRYVIDGQPLKRLFKELSIDFLWTFYIRNRKSFIIINSLLYFQMRPVFLQFHVKKEVGSPHEYETQIRFSEVHLQILWKRMYDPEAIGRPWKKSLTRSFKVDCSMSKLWIKVTKRDNE